MINARTRPVATVAKRAGWALFVGLAASTLVAQARASVDVTTALGPGVDPLSLSDRGWAYHAGDDPAWSAPSVDDATWERLETTAFRRGGLPHGGWPGIGWFRLRLRSQAPENGRTLAVMLQHWGASEIYLDGRLVRRFGDVQGLGRAEAPYNPRWEPAAIHLEADRDHVVAVRYSFAAMRDVDTGWNGWFARGGELIGFEIRLGDPTAADRRRTQTLIASLWIAALGAGLLGLAALHALLYVFYPSVRENLHFSAGSASLAGSLLLGLGDQLGHFGFHAESVRVVAGLALLGAFTVFYLYFLHETFERRRPSWLRLYAAAWIVGILVVIWDRGLVNLGVGGLLLVFVVAAVRLVIAALRDGAPGARLVAAGVAAGLMLPLMNVAQALGLAPSRGVRVVLGQIALGGLVLAMSAHLARRVGETSRNLQKAYGELEVLARQQVEHERQEAQTRVEQAMERAELQRQRRELERARDLQLSMLPAQPPGLPHLEIAMFTRPATEVGGDFYDFHVQADGTVTIALADATGHGLRAGIVVVAGKSAFRSHAAIDDIGEALSQMSRVLAECELGGAFLAMQLVKIRDGQLRLGSAGLPFATIYRADTGEAETIAVAAPPLGMPVSVGYDTASARFAPGDVVVLMTDGYPERFNGAEVMLGYERASALLRDIGGEPAETIVRRFVEDADAWGAGHPQDDDMTFVVIRAVS